MFHFTIQVLHIPTGKAFFSYKRSEHFTLPVVFMSQQKDKLKKVGTSMNMIIEKSFLPIFLIICSVFIHNFSQVESYPSQGKEDISEGGKQEWSEKDLIRLRKGFERIRWTFHEFIRRLYEPKKAPSRVSDHHGDASIEEVELLKDLVAQIRDMDQTLKRRLEEVPLDDKGLEELNQLVFELNNMFAELSDELRKIPIDGGLQGRQLEGSPDYGNTILGFLGETTQQMRNMNDRMAQISAQMSRIMQTGARIVTGQMRTANGSSDSLNPWSYGEPAFRGITASMEMLQKLQSELSTLNAQWRDLAWKMVPTSIIGQDSASSDRRLK